MTSYELPLPLGRGLKMILEQLWALARSIMCFWVRKHSAKGTYCKSPVFNTGDSRHGLHWSAKGTICIDRTFSTRNARILFLPQIEFGFFTI